MSLALIRRKGIDLLKLDKSSHMALARVNSTTVCDEVMIDTFSDKAVITLSRPKSLNALTLPMIKAINPFMKKWQSETGLKMIIIKGAGEKAFCAGGMIPDVGGGHFLPRLLGGLGNFLALTGFRLKGRDTLRAGIATHFVESAKIDRLEEDLLRLASPSLEDIKEILDHYHDETILGKDTPFVLTNHQALINNIFSSYNIEDIFNGLEKDGSDWSKTHLETLAKMSPTSLKLTLEQMRRGKNMSLKQVLEMEYRVVIRIVQNNEFFEGVRALLIDKDMNPNWKPSSFKEVTNSIVDSYFEELPPNEELIL